MQDKNTMLDIYNELKDDAVRVDPCIDFFTLTTHIVQSCIDDAMEKGFCLACCLPIHDNFVHATQECLDVYVAMRNQLDLRKPRECQDAT